MSHLLSPEEALLDEVLYDSGPLREIILHNDDVNTFDHVIESLMEVCGHDPIQAEQCAWIVHYNGKCSVKRGAYDDLESYSYAVAHDLRSPLRIINGFAQALREQQPAQGGSDRGGLLRSRRSPRSRPS